jgi:hypothetical protein
MDRGSTCLNSCVVLKITNLRVIRIWWAMTVTLQKCISSMLEGKVGMLPIVQLGMPVTFITLRNMHLDFIDARLFV